MSTHLSNQDTLPDLAGLLWWRWFFTSELSLGFWVFAGNVLEQVGWAILVYFGGGVTIRTLWTGMEEMRHWPGIVGQGCRLCLLPE